MCDKCGNEYVDFRYTQIINGIKKEINLCSKCARELGLDNMNMGLSFDNFFEDLWDFRLPEKSCKRCGTTLSDFTKNGNLGCSECFDTFNNVIDRALINVQGTNRTKKIKEVEGKKENKKSKKEELEEALKKAIEKEEYEEAAKIRDQIKELN